MDQFYKASQLIFETNLQTSMSSFFQSSQQFIAPSSKYDCFVTNSFNFVLEIIVRIYISPILKLQTSNIYIYKNYLDLQQIALLRYYRSIFTLLLQQITAFYIHKMKNTAKPYRETPSSRMAQTILIPEEFSPTFNNLTFSQIASAGTNSNPQQNQLPQQGVKFTFRQVKLKAKSTIIDYLKNKLKTNSFTEATFNNLVQVQNASNLTHFFELFFNVIKDAVTEVQPRTPLEPATPPSISNKDLFFSIKSKQCKKIRLMKDDELQRKKKKRSFRHLNIVQKTNEELKKQLFDIKDENNRLQKIIAEIAEDFRDRKNFYLAQIKKLTQILSVSAKDVRNFVMQQTKQARLLEEKQHRRENTLATRGQIEYVSGSQMHRNLTGTSYRTGTKYLQQKQNSNFSNARAALENTSIKKVMSHRHLDQQRNEMYLY